MRRIGVIGGGLAGLSAAFECARRGMQVTLYESRREIGGRGGGLESEGWRLDVGPHLMRKGGPLHQLMKRTRGGRLNKRPLRPGGLAYLGSEGLTPIIDQVQGRADSALALNLKRTMRLLKHGEAEDESEFSDWLQAQSPALQPALSLWAVLSSMCPPHRWGGLIFHKQRISECWPLRRLLRIREGWGGAVSRIIAACNQLEVEWRVGISAEGIRFSNKSRKPVIISAESRTTFDALVITTPPNVARKLLESSGLDQTALPQPVDAVNATTWDLGLGGNFLRPHEVIWDAERCLLVVDATGGEASTLVPTESTPGTTLLQLMAFEQDAEGVEEREAKMRDFLQERCHGWTDNIQLSRLNSKLVVSSTDPSVERPLCTQYAASRIWLAGDWVSSSSWLADGAVESACLAAESIIDQFR